MAILPVSVTVTNIAGLSATASSQIETTPVAVWPNASNTGVPAGTVLTASGSITANTDGMIIENKVITGGVVINARNVTLRNCRIIGTGWFCVHVTGGTLGKALNFKMENCTVTRPSNNKGGKGVYFAFKHVTAGTTWVKRCNFSLVEDGIYVEANDILIEDNYMANFGAQSTDPHHDGIQVNWSNNITMRHNNLDLGTNDISSVIVMADSLNNTVENNRLNGGAYTVRMERTCNNIKILNNTFLNEVFGYINGDPNPPILTISGNVDVNGNVVN